MSDSSSEDSYAPNKSKSKKRKTTVSGKEKNNKKSKKYVSEDESEESEDESSLSDDSQSSSGSGSSSSDDDSEESDVDVDDDDDSDEESEEDWKSSKKNDKKKTSKKSTSSKKKVEKSKSKSQKQVKPSKKSTSSQRGKKQVKSKAEVEDGELSHSENDDSSSSDSSVFNDGYGSDLMKDDEDRRKLESMTEKEREEELFRRTEMRDRLLKQFELRKKLKQQQKAARREEREKKRQQRQKSNKSKSLSNKKSAKFLDDDDEQVEKSSKRKLSDDDGDYESAKDTSMSKAESIMDRRKANESKKKDTGVSKALANLKADREKKKQLAEDNRQRMEKQIQQQNKLRTEDVFSSSSEDESKKSPAKHKSHRHGSDDDYRSGSDSGSGRTTDDDDESDSDKEEKKFINTKEELSKIKLSRFKIEKWCHAPFFKKVACGCFIRVGIGNNTTGSVYRVAEVIDVIETGKVYQLGTTRTNKGFKIRHGTEERVYRLEFVSNQAFTDDEFKRWKDTMAKNNLPLPTQREIDTKSKEIGTYVNYRFKDEDVDFIVKEKKRFQKDSDRFIEKKLELMKAREKAVEENDAEKLKEIDEQIEELNERVKDIDVKRKGNFNMLAEINKRNREQTSAAMEEAMKQEYNQRQSDDPFQRRKCMPTLVTAAIKKGSQSQGSSTNSSQTNLNEPKKEEPNRVRIDEILPISLTINRKTELETNKASMDSMVPNSSEMFNHHNFEIKIDLAIPVAEPQVKTVVNVNPVNASLPRRALNLDEYKRRQGLI